MANAAILIGNSSYSSLRALPCCKADLHAMKELIEATEKYSDIYIVEDSDADVLKTKVREQQEPAAEDVERQVAIASYSVVLPGLAPRLVLQPVDHRACRPAHVLHSRARGRTRAGRPGSVPVALGRADRRISPRPKNFSSTFLVTLFAWIQHEIFDFYLCASDFAGDGQAMANAAILIGNSSVLQGCLMKNIPPEFQRMSYILCLDWPTLN